LGEDEGEEGEEVAADEDAGDAVETDGEPAAEFVSAADFGVSTGCAGVGAALESGLTAPSVSATGFCPAEAVAGAAAAGRPASWPPVCVCAAEVAVCAADAVSLGRRAR
jgi:hypothetical protein